MPKLRIREEFLEQSQNGLDIKPDIKNDIKNHISAIVKDYDKKVKAEKAKGVKEPVIVQTPINIIIANADKLNRSAIEFINSSIQYRLSKFANTKTTIQEQDKCWTEKDSIYDLIERYADRIYLNNRHLKYASNGYLLGVDWSMLEGAVKSYLAKHFWYDDKYNEEYLQTYVRNFLSSDEQWELSSEANYNLTYKTESHRFRTDEPFTLTIQVDVDLNENGVIRCVESMAKVLQKYVEENKISIHIIISGRSFNMRYKGVLKGRNQYYKYINDDKSLIYKFFGFTSYLKELPTIEELMNLNIEPIAVDLTIDELELVKLYFNNQGIYRYNNLIDYEIDYKDKNRGFMEELAQEDEE